mgnify:CR=1 FL=1
MADLPPDERDDQGGSRKLQLRTVGIDGPDIADMWIADRCGKGDVVVTGDIPLAAKCVEAGTCTAPVIETVRPATAACNWGSDDADRS